MPKATSTPFIGTPRTKGSRAAKISTGPRKPARAQGVVRFNELLDATERLLIDHGPDEIGLYQIAAAADAPTASVYHFFPTKNAAFLALAERYLRAFVALSEEPVPAATLRSWQNLIETDYRRSMEFYNRHPPAMKIIFGGYGSLDIRRTDAHFNASIAASIYDRLNAAFHMPPLRDAAAIFHIGVTIVDAIWALSYQKHGEITEDYYRKSQAACEAYCRLFLPAEVEPRERYLQAAERGELVRIQPLAVSVAPTE